MLLKVTDLQYNQFTLQLSRSIQKAKTIEELKLLQPSLIMAQRQSTTTQRTAKILWILKDFNRKCKDVC